VAKEDYIAHAELDIRGILPHPSCTSIHSERGSDTCFDQQLLSTELLYSTMVVEMTANRSGAFPMS
jgi:hypothetical protein